MQTMQAFLYGQAAYPCTQGIPELGDLIYLMRNLRQGDLYIQPALMWSEV